MMTFIFGGGLDTPRPDRGIIFKEQTRGNSTLVEIDLSQVEKQLANKGIEINELDIKDVVKSVVYSIWRMRNWESFPITTNIK